MAEYIYRKGHVFFILFMLIVCGQGVVLDCYRTTIHDYDGHQQTTNTGTPCKRWDSVEHNFKAFPDASVSDAGNFCRNPDRSGTLWCITESSPHWGVCGITKCDNNDSTQCGTFSVKQSSKLGDNITFTFTPDEKDSNAILEWQQRKMNDKRWATLPFNPKFIQYIKDGVYSLVLTSTTFQISENVSYRVHYYNNTLHCLMETPKIIFQDKNYTTTLCGEFTVQQTSELGDNITFAFKPDEKFPGAILKWQQTNLEGKRWTTLPLNPKFIQYIKDGVYSLVLTNATFQISKDVSYRVHYYNETMHCLMETPKIIYQENKHPEKNKKEDVDILFNWIIICVCAVSSITIIM